MTASRGGPRGILAIAMLVLVGLVLCPSFAQAQTLYGSIIGQVTDPQKAALPGVAVTATNSGTGLKLEALTDGTGNFIFRNLPPGSYDIKAVLEGFKELVQTGLSVTAGNPRRLDLTLQLGGMQETVTVTAETTLIKTERADLSTELSSKAVTTLPLNQYRNYQTLLNLVPGATPTQEQNALIDTPGRSLRTWVNGVQPNANTTRVDGAVSINVWLPHHAGYISPAETIDTVNISTNNFDSDTGMAAGAAQNVITKSGTNQLKGSAFEFMNRDGFNANSFYNNAFDIDKNKLKRDTFGGTLGGPIIHNKLFYFGSYEKYRERYTYSTNYSVPTAKMRNGDFSEVPAVYPKFQLYNPFSSATSAGRTTFANNQIPSNLINPISAALISQYYPAVNSASDLNSNGFLDDYLKQWTRQTDRANYDLKLTWQRNPSHSIWGKISTLKADVVDNFVFGFDNGAKGDTNVYVGSLGHTWTLNSSTVLDGNFGYYRQDQNVLGPDFGTNYGLQLGIPGVNDPNDIRNSGLPTFETGFSTLGSTPNWMPLWRKEVNWSFSSALTKVYTKHEMRVGYDFVRLELNHRQAEWGNYGLKGGFQFSGNTTGGPGYTALYGNQFASFLLGLPSFFAKDTQTEEMTGRENQHAFYIRDRWRPSEKLTVNAGLRLEYFPLMSRATHGLEVLDYSNFMVSIGGLGDVPKDNNIKVQSWYLEPRLGLSYRLTEKSVFRAGYGMTRNPIPWSRPLRGSFPQDINFSQSADQYMFVTTMQKGIPTVVLPDYSSGHVLLPYGVYMRSPNKGQEMLPGTGSGLDRGRIQQWNLAFEYKLPFDIAAQIAYVGTATDGGYADLNLNYGEPAGGNASRHYYKFTGTQAVNDWAARTKSRYKGLQVELNRPFTKGLMLKGAYTWSRAKDMTTNGEDGWVGLTYNHPSLYDKNFDIAVFDRTHVFQLGFVYELPIFKNNQETLGKVLGGWSVNGVLAAYSGTPYGIGGVNNPMNCPACGTIYANFQGDPKALVSAGSMGATDYYFDKTLFSNPTGLGVDGWGNTTRTYFRRPSAWNLDMSLFKSFIVGRFRPEIRIEAANVLNHVNWGAPNTSITSVNFMRFSPGNAESGTNTPGPRRLQLGFRVSF